MNWKGKGAAASALDLTAKLVFGSLWPSSLDRESRNQCGPQPWWQLHSFHRKRGSKQVLLCQVLLKALPHIPIPPAAWINKYSKHKHLFRADLIKLHCKHRFSGSVSPDWRVKRGASVCTLVGSLPKVLGVLAWFHLPHLWSLQTALTDLVNWAQESCSIRRGFHGCTMGHICGGC